MSHSAVLIIPAALKPAADALGESMGWGPVSYTIPLGDGESVTHYAARADVSTQFIRWVRGLDPLPDPSAQPIIDALIVDFSPDPHPHEGSLPPIWGQAHLERVLQKISLRRMSLSAGN